MFTTPQENILQPKLTIGQPKDRYEREADAVANQVMQMPTSQIPAVQRKCEECEEEELQMKPLADIVSPIIQKRQGEEEALQMKGYGSEGASVPNLESSLQRSKGGGHQLDTRLQSQMGRGIGADFSRVKIHTDSNAVQMNRQLNAKAFTNGSDIYFNQGQYKPQSSEGKHLLAHELTHVVQQANHGNLKSIQKQEPGEGDDRENEDQIDPLVRRVADGNATEEERQELRNQLSERDLTRAEAEYIRARIEAEVRAQLPGLIGQMTSGLTVNTSGVPGNRELCYRIDGTIFLSGRLAAVNGFEGQLSTTARITSSASDESSKLEIAVPTGDYRPAIMARNFVFPNGPLVFDFGEPGYRTLGMLVNAPMFLNFDVVGPNTESTSNLVIGHADVPRGARLNVTLIRDDNCTAIPEQPVSYLDTIPPWRAYAAAGIGGASGNPLGAFSFGLDMPLVAGDFGLDFNDRELVTVPDLGYGGLGVRIATDTRGAVTLGGAAFVGLDLQPLRFQFGATLGAEYLPENARGPDLPEWNLRYGIEGILSYQVLEHLDILAIGSGEFGDGPNAGSFRLGIGIPFL